MTGLAGRSVRSGPIPAAGVVGALGAAALIGVIAAVTPIAAAALLAAVFGLAAARAAWLYPKAYVGAAATAVWFSPMLEAAFPPFANLDESLLVGIVVLTLARTLAGLSAPRAFPGMYGIAVFFLLGALGTLVAHAPGGLAVQDAFLLSKGLLVYACVAQLPWVPSDVDVAVRWALKAVVVTFVLFVLNMGTGAHWYTLFAIANQTITRGGFLSPIGPFGHPGVAGQALAMISSAAIAYGLTVRRTRWMWLLPLLSLPFLLLTLRRKAIIGFVAACGLVLASGRSVRLRAGLVLAVLFPALVVVLGPILVGVIQETYQEYIVGATDAARSLLYNGAGVVANQHFPFGVGFSRYGTYVAFQHYSPVYYELGLNRNWGLAPGTGLYGTDTFWPAVLGETGWLGMLGFGWVLAAAGRTSWRLRRHVIPQLRFIGLVGAAWSLDMVLESLASPVYSATPHYTLFFSVLGVVAALSRLQPSGGDAAPGAAASPTSDA